MAHVTSGQVGGGWALILLLACAPLFASEEEARTADGRDDARWRAEIEKLLAGQAAAWNRGDLDAFCEVYDEDALFLSPSGVTRGRGEILERYRKRYADRAAMGTLSLEVFEVDVAPARRSRAVRGISAAARWKLSYDDREDADGLTLLVFRRIGDRWLIVQDASM